MASHARRRSTQKPECPDFWPHPQLGGSGAPPGHVLAGLGGSKSFLKYNLYKFYLISKTFLKISSSILSTTLWMMIALLALV